MKTTEIMIGDWFWYGGIGFKVAEIKGREIVSELMVDPETRMGMDIKTTADKLHHIRLTPELLEKNGFVRDCPTCYFNTMRLGKMKRNNHE